MERFIYELTENCPNGNRTFRYENATRDDAMRYARASCNPYTLTEIKQESSPAYAYPIYDAFSHKIVGRNTEPDWRTVSKEVILRHS